MSAFLERFILAFGDIFITDSVICRFIKRIIINYISLPCLIVIFGPCSKPVTDSLVEIPVIEIPCGSDEIIEIKEWLAVGPFSFNTRRQSTGETFGNDDLKRYKIIEDEFTDNDIIKLANSIPRPFIMSGLSAQFRMFDYVLDEAGDKSNFYLSCILSCIEDMQMTLIADGSNSYRLWLNQELLLEVSGKHNINKVGDRFINCHLKKGRNLLFIKVNRAGNMRSWDFTLAVSPEVKAQEIYNANYFSDFIVNPLPSDSLEIYLGPYRNAGIFIEDERGAILYRDSIANSFGNAYKTINLSGPYFTEDNFYKCRLTFNGGFIEEYFYKGNYSNLTEYLNASLQIPDLDESAKNDLLACFQRIAFLSDEEITDGSVSELRNLNRNKVFWAKSLYDLLNAVKTDKGLKNAPGTAIRTYMSEKGDSVFHFVFHAGQRAAQNPEMPLIIVVPYGLEGEFMLNDWYLTNLDQIVIDNAMADIFGFAVAWVYMSGKNYTAASAVKDIIGVLNRIRADYNLDFSGIFILGDCEGGRRALVLAEQNPSLFRGIAVTSPLISNRNGETSLLELIGNLTDIPLIIRHGIYDEVSSIENSRLLFSEAHKYGIEPVFLETMNSHLTFNRDYRKYAFEFFDSIRNFNK